MKTPEQIREYLKYIKKQREEWVPESMKPDASTNTLVQARVAEEIESTLQWVLDSEKPEESYKAYRHRVSSDKAYVDHVSRFLAASGLEDGTTVEREINRSEGRREPESQEAESKPWDKLWGACASEDGFVAAVDPADLQSIRKMGREIQAAAQTSGSTGHAIGMDVYKSVCSPGANVMAASYRLTMLGFCEQMGLLPGCKRDGDYTDAVFQVAATFPMKLMQVGVTYQEPPFDVEEFMKQVGHARAG